MRVVATQKKGAICAIAVFEIVAKEWRAFGRAAGARQIFAANVAVDKLFRSGAIPVRRRTPQPTFAKKTERRLTSSIETIASSSNPASFAHVFDAQTSRLPYRAKMAWFAGI